GEVTAWATISTLSRTSNTVTVTATGAHGLSVGNTVIIIGTISDSFVGTFTVASVPNSTTFTYSQTASNETATRAGKFAKALEKDTVHDDVENVFSGEGNDWLDGNSSANSLNGAGGNDTLRGRDAGDTMVGGAGT